MAEFNTAGQQGLMKLVQTNLEVGCVKAFTESSILLSVLSFIPNKGSLDYYYNVVDAGFGAKFRELGENIGGQQIESDMKHERLKIITADVVLDRLFTNGRVGNISDIKAENTLVATGSLANKFCKTFYYGDPSVDSKAFTGLVPRIQNGIGAKLDGLTLANLDEAIDTISYNNQGTKILLMNNKTRRKIQALVKAEGYRLTNMEFAGQSVTQYDGLPIVVDPNIENGEIFVVNFSEADGVGGLTLDGIRADEQGFEGTAYRIAVEGVFAIFVKRPDAFVLIKEVE